MRARRFHPQLEPLEDRITPIAYTPQQVVGAYGIDQIPLPSGQFRGAGQTIALIEQDNDINFPSSLTTFDQQFNLPDPPSFQVIGYDARTSQAVSATSGLIPQVRADAEFALDVEWTHVIAPGANILVVAYVGSNFGTNGATQLAEAMNFAAQQPGVSVVSASLGFNQFGSEANVNSLLTTPSGHSGVTYFAPVGDGNNGYQLQFPSVSPNVVAVSATTLNLNADGSYQSETAWSLATGGQSQESEPLYQDAVNTSGFRDTPDVAFVGSDTTGVQVLDVPSQGFVFTTGTSLGAPAWAGLVAIANQIRANNGLAPLDGVSQTLPRLYALPESDFNPITALDDPNDRLAGDPRSATLNPAYNLFTGRGTPIANLLVPQLALANLTTVSAYFATGTDAGIPALVDVFDLNGNLLASFYPFGTNFTGGVRVAIGDVNGDGVPDLVVGSGPGGITAVQVYDGATLLSNLSNPTAALARAFFPYGSSFAGGTFVAVGNLDGGTADEIVTGADAGGGPQVNVYSAAQIAAGQFNTPAAVFDAYAPGFTGGVRVAVGDVNGDGLADLVTAAGPGGGPQINVYYGTTAPTFLQTLSPNVSFDAFAPTFAGGVYVTVGAVNSAGQADLFFGAGAGGGPQVTVFSGSDPTQAQPDFTLLASFYALAPTFTGGVRVGTTQSLLSTGSPGPVLLTAAGPGGGPQVTEYDPLTILNAPGSLVGPLASFESPPGNFPNGIFVSV